MTVTAMPGAEEETKPQGRKKKKIIVILLVLALAGGGAYFFLLKPKGPKVPQPGTVLVLDDQSLNLAGGHMLTISVGLQLTKDAPEDLDGSLAMEDVIDTFSGQQIADVDTAKVRKNLEAQLQAKIETDYKGHVMQIYIRKFATM